MGLLAWLGLRSEDAYPNIDALMRELRRALPDDEAVVLRYIAIVIVLLGKVAYADGRLNEGEEQNLRALLSHIGRLAPSGVEAVCTSLRGQSHALSEDELALCYRELKALCDGKERREVLRLLAQLAASDGALAPAELQELETIAEEIGIPRDEVSVVLDRETSVGEPPPEGRTDPA
jgi:DnaJ like chaperone protein